MGETIAVLLIFFVLLVLAFFFFSNIEAAGAKKAAAIGVQEQGIRITQIASYLPELQCSTDNTVAAFNCIDLEKAKSAAEVLQRNRVFYTSVFGFANISIQTIYPDPCKASQFMCATPSDIVLYEVVKPEYSSAEFFPVPVSLYEPQNQTYSFGVLKVTVYG